MTRRIAWAAGLGGGLVLSFLALCGLLAAREIPMTTRFTPRPGTLGRYRVAVLGDSQKGITNLKNILRRAREERADLLLQTGDIVSSNDEGHYQLLAHVLMKEAFGIPLVIVPGNHDIKGGAERFVERIGPLEQSFRIGEVGFVLIENAFGIPPDPGHIESRIAAAGPHRAIVLAMHVPPFDEKGGVQPGYEPFLAWLEKSRVRYLLCGHVHGYFKKQVGGTTVIVNGVGGDYGPWELGKKVHATILEVDGATITDRAIEIPPGHGVWDNVEHLAIGHVAEAYRRHPVLCWGATLLLAAGVGFSIGVIRLKRP
ncbi:MAG TPA: metallophosphoesterase [Planctomycetota bacterium]|nr:metallophosphoesterase [Planctomycetota bacterium]